LSKDYFNSIEELPIWNWWKVSETGNLSYLRRDENYNKNCYPFEEWVFIQNEYLEMFGRTSQHQSFIRLKKKWIDKKADYLISGDRFNLTELDIIESDLSEVTNTNGNTRKEDTVIFLEQKLGREINTRKISVKKYYDYIDYFSKNNNN
jgi:hypothetical protein